MFPIWTFQITLCRICMRSLCAFCIETENGVLCSAHSALSSLEPGGASHSKRSLRSGSSLPMLPDCAQLVDLFVIWRSVKASILVAPWVLSASELFSKSFLRLGSFFLSYQVAHRVLSVLRPVQNFVYTWTIIVKTRIRELLSSRA